MCDDGCDSEHPGGHQEVLKSNLLVLFPVADVVLLSGLGIVSDTLPNMEP